MNGSAGNPRTLKASEPVGELELVHSFDAAMPTGVTVSRSGRVFVNFPEWGDHPQATVVELRGGEERPYPDSDWNSAKDVDDAGAFVSVQSVVVDPADRLWVLDTGSPMFQPTRYGGPKLVCVDLTTDEVINTIIMPRDVALETTYLNDVRFDLTRGAAGAAYITDSSDSGPNGMIVVDLDSGETWRRLHDHPSTKAVALDKCRPIVEGRPFLKQPGDGPAEAVAMGADGIAIAADGERLWYCPLASRHWYSVSTEALFDRSMSDDEVAETVVDEGDKGGVGDGLETDDKGRFYITAGEHNAVLRRLPDGTFETLLYDVRLLWPDTLSVAEGYLYVTANQLHRQADYQGGKDRREPPYALFRTPIDAGPVRLIG
jgi:sugar lactone lactonase YvrE